MDRAGQWSNWQTWLFWVLASTLGWAGGLGLLLLLLGLHDRVSALIGLVIFGAVVGLAQWLILRWQIPRAGWWVASSALGIAASAVLAWLVVQAAPLVLNLLLGAGEAAAHEKLLVVIPGLLLGALFGGLAGFFQTLALPSYVWRTSPWALASAAGGALDGIVIGLLLWSSLGRVDPAFLLLPEFEVALAPLLSGFLGALAGPFKGLATGIVLATYDLK